MNQAALEAAFKEWWEASYGRPPGTHAVMTHAAFAAYILHLIPPTTRENGMTDQQHPITPPPELVAKIRSQALSPSISQQDYEDRLVVAAYRAGADYELNAILALAKNPGDSDEDCYFDGFTVAGIRGNRRPVPPSLAEEALAVLDDTCDRRDRLDAAHENIIRRALERLQELEGQDQLTKGSDQ